MDILAAKLVARALHDVAGPTSGLTSALDLLSDPGSDGALRAEALDLARESLTQMSDKIVFCRAAFGGGGLEGLAVDDLLQAPFARGRARLEAPVIPTEAPVALKSALLILALIASESLAAGGVATLNIVAAPGAWTARLAAKDARARLHPETRRGLEGEGFTEGLPGRWAPARLLHAQVARSGGDLSLEAVAGSIAVRITWPT